MVSYYLGTIGFRYKKWIGNFYPLQNPSNKTLNYYSQVFNSVEVDLISNEFLEIVGLPFQSEQFPRQ